MTKFINSFASLFNFTNLSNKIRKLATTFSAIYMVLGTCFSFLGVLAALFNGYIGGAILIILLFPLIMLFLHIPLWFTYAFADVYDSLCKYKVPSDEEELKRPRQEENNILD